MQSTPQEQRIRGAIEPSVAAMGYGLVRVRLREGGGRQVLEVMAERADDAAMAVEDCEKISRQASALLDVEDPIHGAYDLEVMSPGLDRPLMSPADFRRFAGREAKVETMLPIEGRKRFRGVIKGVEGEEITLVLEDGQAQIIACSGIRSAKLVPQEELFGRKPKKVNA